MTHKDPEKRREYLSTRYSTAIAPRTSRRRYWLSKYQSAKGCQCCGYSESASAMDWHHRNPEEKDGEVPKLTYSPLKRLFQEIRKCVLLCANCHRRVHAGELQIGVV